MSHTKNERLPRGVWLASGAVIVLLLSVAGRYGFHRDELYFIAAGRRLDWGYVDQPPLTPLVARLTEALGGATPWAFRILPALAIGGVVLLAAAMARRFGGSQRAQVFAAVASGGAGFALAVGHLLSTATFEYFLWTLAAWMLVKILAGDDPRWWLGFGLTIGIGLQNKHLIGIFAAAVLIGMLATKQRSLLRSKWPWIGAAIAALIALPNVVWQFANGLPQLEMAEALAGRSDGPIVFILEQVGLLSIVLAVPATIGLVRLLRGPDLERWRPLGVTFVVLFALFLTTGGKAYYVAPLYPTLLAAGSLWFADLTGAKRTIMVGATAVGVVIGLFIALPLLPASSMSTFDATGELGETVGWPELIDQVEEVYLTIPEDHRDAVVIFTSSYGEAGAVEVLGEGRGLPAAVSGHNTYWLWGPPDRHGPIIGVGQVEEPLRRICPDVARVGTITNPYGVENEEAGLPLLLCVSPQAQLADIWDDVRHYN